MHFNFYYCDMRSFVNLGLQQCDSWQAMFCCHFCVFDCPLPPVQWLTWFHRDRAPAAKIWPLMCVSRGYRALFLFIHSVHWYVQNVTIPCHSQERLPSSLNSSCHLFLGLPVILVASKFIYNTFLGILFSSTLCTCLNQRNLFNLIVSVIVGFLTIAWISLLVNILQFSFSLSYTGPKILLCTLVSKCLFAFCLSLFISRFLMHIGEGM